MNTRLKHAARTLLAITLLAVFTALSTSCGTARGFGRDLGHVGHGIERAAR